MAIVYVAERGLADSLVGTIQPTATVIAGNFLIMTFAWTGVTTATAPTDTKGNTWQVDIQQANGSLGAIAICSCRVTTNLLTSDTITINGADMAASGHGIMLEEFSGLKISGTFLDKTASNSGADVTVATTGTTAATTQADELAIEASTLQATGPSFIKDTAYTSFTTVNSNRTGTAYRILTATGTQSATCAWTGSAVAWSGAIATYLAEPAPAPTTLKPETRLSPRLWKRMRGPKTGLGTVFALGAEPVPNIPTLKVTAHEPFQMPKQSYYKFVAPDRNVVKTSSAIQAHEPFRLPTQSISIFSSPDVAVPIPRTTKIVAQDAPQKQMQPYAKLAYADIVGAALSPLITRRLTAHDLPSLTKVSGSISLGVDLAPDPLTTRKVLAFDVTQKIQQPYTTLVRPDAIVDPLLHKATAFETIQKLMQPYTKLVSSDITVDPLLRKAMIAHSTEQKVSLSDSILITPDLLPQPLYTRRDAIETIQKQMQPYSKLAYVDIPPSILNPLLARKLVAHEPPQLTTQSLSIFASPDVSFDSSLARRVVAFDAAQKLMQPYSKLAYADVIAVTLYPLLVEAIQAHSPIGLTPYSRWLLAVPDIPAVIPETHRIFAHEPVQAILESLSILGAPDNIPSPLQSRRIIAQDTIQKVMQAYSLLASRDAGVPEIKRSIIAHDPVQLIMETLTLLGIKDRVSPDSRRTIAHEPIQQIMEPTSIQAGEDLLPSPLVNVSIAHEPIHKVVQIYNLLKAVEGVVPQTRRMPTHDPVQLAMEAISILGRTEAVSITVDPLATRRIVAHSPAQLTVQSLSIFASPDSVPEPLLLKATAVETIQKQMQPYSKLAYADVVITTLDPLRVRRVIAHDVVQKAMQVYNLLAKRELAAAETHKVVAHSVTQQEMITMSILAGRDAAPSPLLSYNFAHDPVQLAMEATSILGRVDVVVAGTLYSTKQVIAHNPAQPVKQSYYRLVVPDSTPSPLLQKITAFETVQKQMQPYAKLAYADVVVGVALDPLRVRRVIAQDTIQKAMQVYSLLARRETAAAETHKVSAHSPEHLIMDAISILGGRELTPSPLLNYNIAHDPIQQAMEAIAIAIVAATVTLVDSASRKVTAHDPIKDAMEALSILARRDAGIDPLITRKITAFDLGQREMVPYAKLAYADPQPISSLYPLTRKANVAHDPLQAALESLSLVGYRDVTPDPLTTRRIVAFDITQKQMQPLSYLAYIDLLVDPLRTRRITAHEPTPDLMETLTILGRREGIPYPLQLRALAHEPLHKIMQPIPLLIRPDRAPDPLLARYVRAHDPLQLSMDTTTLLITADRGVPDTHKIQAFDPKQKVMEPFWLVGIKENTPYPLLTRLITAHEPTQKFLLSRFLVGYGFPSSDVIHKFSGYVIGRMWSAYFGRGWDGREEKAWEANEGKAWEGRHFRGWKR